jgi:ADP-dependent NAD(P)H-hydrate dehydratase
MSEAAPVTPEALCCVPLPAPDRDGDKEARGRVLVVAGALEMPGAAVLAGTAALRAGAGKLQIATCTSIAPLVGTAVPEALAIRLPETPCGGIAPEAADLLRPRIAAAQAVLMGPGMVDQPAVDALTEALLPHMVGTAIVLDACALASLGESGRLKWRFAGPAVLTPHLGEMARLIGVAKEEVRRCPLELARKVADATNAVIMLKGPDTYIVAPDGIAHCYRGGRVGLATSGSGDTLAGVVAGLLARGATPVEAGCWAAFLHGEAGNRLEKRHGLIGFLARELLGEIPGIMASLAPR